jgi:hypothetical protein
MPAAYEFNVLESDYELPAEVIPMRMDRDSMFAMDRVTPTFAPAIPMVRSVVQPAPQIIAQPEPIAQRPAPARPQVGTVRSGVNVAAASPQPIMNDAPVIRRMEVPFESPVAREAQNTGALFARTAVAGPAPASTARNAANIDEVPLNRLSPMQLRRAFQKTYVSENQHLSTYRIDDRFDVASEMMTEIRGFDTARDLSETNEPRVLEIRIGFRGNDSSLSRDNFQQLSSFAELVVRNPRRAIQIAIPESSTQNAEGRRLAARRLAIVEQVLRDSGVPDTRIMPVLSQRDGDAFVLRNISTDTFQTLVERQRDIFGDTVSTTTQRSLSW